MSLLFDSFEGWLDWLFEIIENGLLEDSECDLNGLNEVGIIGERGDCGLK